MSVLPPELESSYEILGPIGGGGMGMVYKARHRHLDTPCVIKVIRGNARENNEARQRFLSEAKKGRRVRHHNITEVYDFYVGQDGSACLVLEYVDGVNLRQILETMHTPMDPKQVVTIGVQVLAALGCLHEHQLVHRDISPDNLMLTKEPDGSPLVKLIDLGIAMSPSETRITETDKFIGKVAYAAPEQILGVPEPRSDFYSFGIVLYELLTLELPLTAPNTAALIHAHLSGTPRSFDETDRAHRVPEPLRRVVLKALEKKPEDRFQSAAEFADALRRTLTGGTATEPLHGPSSAPTVRDSAVPTIPRHSPAAVTDLTPEQVSGKPEPFGPLWLAGVVSVVVLAVAGFAASVFVTRQAPQVTKKQAERPSNTTTQVTVTAPAPPQGGLTPPDGRTKTASAAITRGKQLAAAGDMKGAYNAFSLATKNDPENAYGWANLGGAASVLGHDREAAAAYEHSLRLDPANWLAHYNLGCLYARQGDPDGAFRHLESAVSQMRQSARSNKEWEEIAGRIRRDDALKELRDDPRFDRLLEP